MNNIISFTLDKTESNSAREFIKQHMNCCEEILNKEIFSSTGGGFSYIITPTGLGLHINIRCNSCGKTKDITNSKNW